MKKRVLRILAVVIIILIIVVVLFRFRFQKMVSTIDGHELINVDLSKIGDGIYRGEFGDFLVKVELEVTVKDHTITDISILEQTSGKGYEATEIIDRIIQNQNTNVAVVTGATGSSKSIMIAVQKALMKD